MSKEKTNSPSGRELLQGCGKLPSATSQQPEQLLQASELATTCGMVASKRSWKKYLGLLRFYTSSYCHWTCGNGVIKQCTPPKESQEEGRKKNGGWVGSSPEGHFMDCSDAEWFQWQPGYFGESGQSGEQYSGTVGRAAQSSWRILSVRICFWTDISLQTWQPETQKHRFFLLGLLRGFAPAADPACSVRAAVFDTGNSLRNEWFSIRKSACHGSTYIIVTQNAAKLWLLSKRILNLNDVETTSWLPTGADRSRHSYTSSTSTGRACQVDEISYF